MNAVETSALGKRYRSTWALRDCTLVVPAGRVVALVGPNGAGKTTLLHCVVGLARPTTGAVTLLGGMPAGSAAALGAAAFVAQNAPLLARLSVKASISLTAALNEHFESRLAQERMRDLGIPLTRQVSRLSSGQQAELALSLALARRPALLVLDEPLSRLDPLARHNFMSHLMAQVAEQNMTVVFSSHVVAELERVADYLIILSHGQVQIAGDIDRLLANHTSWSGSADALDQIQELYPVVYCETAGRFRRAVVRTKGSNPPPGWDTVPIGVEELVLAYLRTPSARALPGPLVSGGTQRGGGR